MAVRKASTRKRKAAPKLPLGVRLPNPPAVWVGRNGDLDWLSDAIERAPVSLVTGPGGVGKTALVLQALHSRFARRVKQTLFIDIPPGQPVGQVRQDFLRALASASGVDDLDWAEMQSEPEAATAAAIDLAEAGPFWIVLDDVYQGDAEETNEMLVQLSSYARKSRWITTSRLTPRLSPLAGQILTLAAMTEPELLELARAWTPNAEHAAVRRALAASSGSPWLLHQLLVTGSSESALEREGLLTGLPEDAAHFLRAVALVEMPLPLAVLRLFAPDPGPDALVALQQRGLIQQNASGLRLHDVARGMLLGPRGRPDADASGHAAAVLAQQELPEALLEAARLLVNLGRVEALGALLADHADRIMALGYAPKLFSLLENVSDPTITSWRMRCAAALGNPTALAQVHAPTLSDTAQNLAWARTLRAQGDLPDAITQSQKVLSETGLAPQEAREAQLLLASCLMLAGRFDEADRTLREVDDGGDERVAIRRDAELSLLLVLRGEAIDAPAFRALRQRVGNLPDMGDAARSLGDAFRESALLADAASTLLLARPDGGRPVLLADRQTILLTARLELDGGNLDAARKLADQVRAYARGSSLLLPQLHVVDLTRRLYAGELDGLEPLAASCEAEAEGIDARSDAELIGLRIRLANMRGEEPETVAPSPDSRVGREVALWEALGTARRLGHLPISPVPAGANLESDTRGSAVSRLVQASLALAAGDAVGATTVTAEAVRLTDRARLRLLEADARLTNCEALLCAGRMADLATEAEQLAILAATIGSERFAAESRFFAAAVDERGLRPALLEELASLEQVAPVGARRAQAVLGGEPSLDHVDLRVLETLAISGSTAMLETLGEPITDAQGEPTWVAGWGLDHRDQSVWTSDGRTVPLGSRALSWRILEVLAARGGQASKEELVRTAWEEEEYHPLRHDGRLHVAVRKLRELIEDDSANPKRLMTTDDGYALGPPIRQAR